MIFLLQLAFIFLEDYAFLKKKFGNIQRSLSFSKFFFHKCLLFSRPPSIGLYNTRSHRHPKHPNWRQKYGEKLYFGTRDCTGATLVSVIYLFVHLFFFFFHFIRVTYVYITQESLDAESLEYWRQAENNSGVAPSSSWSVGKLQDMYGVTIRLPEEKNLIPQDSIKRRVDSATISPRYRCMVNDTRSDSSSTRVAIRSCDTGTVRDIASSHWMSRWRP